MPAIIKAFPAGQKITFDEMLQRENAINTSSFLSIEVDYRKQVKCSNPKSTQWSHMPRKIANIISSYVALVNRRCRV